MPHHILKLAYRSLLKNRSFSLISLFGLAVSLAASMVIFQHYFFELSFDKNIPDSERTYRIITRLALQKWLVNFAYKTALPWWIFVLPGIIVACIAMLAISWQTNAAARLNPVLTLSINH